MMETRRLSKRSIDDVQDSDLASKWSGEIRHRKPKPVTVGGGNAATPQSPDMITSTGSIRNQQSPSESFIQEVQRPLREKREAQEWEKLNQMLKEGKIGVKLENSDE